MTCMAALNSYSHLPQDTQNHLDSQNVQRYSLYIHVVQFVIRCAYIIITIATHQEYRYLDL